MKRKSQIPNIAQLQTTKNISNPLDFIRRPNKRHNTMFKPGQNIQMINSFVQSIINKNSFQTSEVVIGRLIDDLINNLTEAIEEIQMRKITDSVIKITNSMTQELLYVQNPQNSLNETFPLPEKQPKRNFTDPISGFSKQNYVRKSDKNHKNSSHQNSLILHKQSQKSIPSVGAQKKLPPLMKQVSQQKLQQFIPLEQAQPLRNSNKKPSYDLDQIVRQRLLKEIQNRKFKDKIDSLNNTLMMEKNQQKKSGFKKSNHSKSSYDLGAFQKSILVKQDCNFDYDGNKIQVTSHSKGKTPLKVLKPLYKITVQKQQQKPSKLNKKYHQKMSFVPRGSRNCLEFNGKTIHDFGETNYTLALKQKLQAELRKTEIKFNEKQIITKEKTNDQQKLKQKERRQSLIP